MKKYLTLSVITLITLFTVFSAFQSRKLSRSTETPPSANSIPLSVQVLSAEEAKQSFSERLFPATITTEGEATLTASVSGTILSDTVSLGSSVHVGQVLYKIDEQGGSPYSDTGFESTALLQAKLALKNAEESYGQAKRDYDKNKSNALKTARDIQKNLRNSALANYTALLDKYTIKSPLSGIISMESASVGDSVTPGKILATISAGQKIARFYVSAEDLPLFSVKQSISLSTNDAVIPGFISHISPIADSASKRFLIEVTSTDKRFQSLPSGTITTLIVTLTRNAQENTVLLPLSALLQEQNGTFVFTIKDDYAHRQEVHIKTIFGETVEVSGDFPAETRFIITNAKRLTEGARISIVSQ